MKNPTRKIPPLSVALLPIIPTIALLATQIFYFKDFAPHMPLAIGLALACLTGWALGYRWEELEDGLFKVIRIAMPALSIFLLVGMIIGLWIASGSVPTLIYYGYELLTAKYFLLSALLICSVVSVALGTSWGTIGTVGLALVGIGSGFGIPVYWTVGAIVSGAYFGDKISPLSDSTNLCSGLTEQNLFDHIKNLMPSTVPAMLIAAVIYVIAGFSLSNDTALSSDSIESMKKALDDQFSVTPWLLAPIVITLVLALRRYAPIPVMFAGVFAGGVVAYFFQGASVQQIFSYANYGYTMTSGVAAVDTLLTRGGVQSMMWNVSLVLISLAYGGVLERTGCMQSLVNAVVSRLKSYGSIHASLIFSGITVNVVAGDPYLAMSLPSRMYVPIYKKMGYSTLNVGRGAEEGGMLSCPLVPWNAAGAFVISTLGLGIAGGDMENLLYIPLSFACWLAPVIGITYAYLGLFTPRAATVVDAPLEKKDEENYLNPGLELNDR